MSADHLAEPDSAQARVVLDAYIAAFENADAAALTRLLRADATLEVTPSRTWFAGNRACAPFLARYVLISPGEYRMYPASANGQPAAVTYRRPGPGQPYAPLGVAVLRTDTTHLVSITAFTDPTLVARFGYPDQPPDWASSVHRHVRG